jgi:hypothetical protein
VKKATFRILRAGGLALLGATALVLSGSAAALAAPTWLLPATNLSAEAPAVTPDVALDAAGDAVAVWSRSGGGASAIEGASRPAGGAFSAPVSLSETGAEVGSPDIAVNGGGDAVVVWVHASPTSSVIEAASRPAGASSFSAPVPLSASDGHALAPRVALDAAGDAVVVWFEAAGAGSVVEAASRTGSTGSFSAPVPVSAQDELAGNAAVALDAAGDAVVVWRQRHSGGATGEIVESASRPAARSSFSDPVPLSAEHETVAPTIALNARGDALAVWSEVDASGHGAVESASRPAGSGAFSAPAPLSPPTGAPVEPHVGLDGAGGAVVVWEDSSGIAKVIEAASRPPGGAFSSPVKLSQPGQDVGAAALVVDAAGDAVALWRRSDSSNFLIEAAARPARGAFSSPVKLSQPGQDAGVSGLGLDVDAAGDAIAVWGRSTGAKEIVQTAGYDAAGPQLRSLSIPTTGTAGKPLSFAVAPLDVFSNPAQTVWSFGDRAKPGAGPRVTHTYAAPGRYQVTVTSTDTLGNATSKSATIVIKPGRPKAIAARIARVRGSKALLKLSCPKAGPCRGAAKLTAKQSKKKILLGKRRFRIAAGKHLTLAIELSTPARQLLEAAGRRGAVARLAGSGVKRTAVRLKH